MFCSYFSVEGLSCFRKPLTVTFCSIVLIKATKCCECDSDIHLVNWLCHFYITWHCHMTLGNHINIYFRIVFRIEKRIWVKMKYSNVCCLMLTMLNNGWQNENWLLRDQSRLENIPNTWQKNLDLNLDDRKFFGGVLTWAMLHDSCLWPMLHDLCSISYTV